MKISVAVIIFQSFLIYLNLSQNNQLTTGNLPKQNWDIFQCISHIAPAILDAEDPTKVFSETQYNVLMKQFLNVLLNSALLKLAGLMMNVKNFNVKERQLREFFVC